MFIKRNTSILLMLSVYILCRAGIADYFPSFTALREDRQIVPPKDYFIVIEDKKSPVTAMAIHGGIIEPKSDIIAQIYAERFDHNLYMFKAFYKGPADISNYLHITSTNFNDPDLLKLTHRSKYCVSFHGHNMHEPVLCVGGRSQQLRKKFLENLIDAGVPKTLGIIVDANADALGFKYPKCHKLRGENKRNIVNTCDQGLQLEMSKAVRDKLLNPANTDLFNNFLKALNETLSNSI